MCNIVKTFIFMLVSMLFAYPVSSRNSAQAAQEQVTQMEAAAKQSAKQLELKGAELSRIQQTLQVHQLTACYCLLSPMLCSLQIFKRCCSKGPGRLPIMSIQVQLQLSECVVVVSVVAVQCHACVSMLADMIYVCLVSYTICCRRPKERQPRLQQN